ncbi:MAG TPA: c-type cytochrome domain-containing protein, partial [Candidatus Dormibacteraeota bacterium]|nr:c-type cytochrome domain-containing protein [Candidatus Dormibacteraeota bacterium]
MPACASELTADLAFFENRIRPLLAEQCFSCHGPDKQKGKLRLDSREAMLAGGEHGPALVPGQPEESKLIEAVRSTNADLQMPPKEPLGSRQVSDLVRWISLGAPWPETPAGATNVARAASPSGAPGKQDGPW